MRRLRNSMMRIGAATTAALVTLGLGPGVAAAAVAATGSTITAAERDEIIAQHNLFRAEVGVPPLTWDDTIAAGAQQWADAKEADGRFEHSGTDLGENLAGGAVKDATIRLATGVGVTPPDDERANYQADPQPAGQEKKQVGHYTQIVWSSTTKVGCGFAPADKLAFGLVVCRYSPPGNFRGQFPYPVGTAVIPQPGLNPVQAAGGGTPQAEASRVEKTEIAQGETTQGETQQGEASPGAVATNRLPGHRRLRPVAVRRRGLADVPDHECAYRCGTARPHGQLPGSYRRHGHRGGHEAPGRRRRAHRRRILSGRRRRVLERRVVHGREPESRVRLFRDQRTRHRPEPGR